MLFALMLHLTSFMIVSTGVLGGAVVHWMLVQAATGDPAAMGPLGRMGARFGMLARVGGLLMIATGINLLHARAWMDVGAPWLTAKLGLVVLLTLNGIVVAGPTAARLDAALAGSAGSGPATAVASPALLVRRLTAYHAMQVAGLAAIVMLAIFGPS